MRCYTAIMLCIIVCVVMIIPVEVSAFFGALFEPPDGKVYHGAQAEVRPLMHPTKLGVDWEGLESYVKACGHRPSIIMHYITLDWKGYYFLLKKIEEMTERREHYMLQIGLDFFNYLPFCDMTGEIASGSYDEKLIALARMFRDADVPVFLRPGYEFGGNGAGRFASREHWIPAWKRIHAIFRENGANKVIFVWNTLDAPDYLDYYPGDDYVDWWGINIFCNNADSDKLIIRFLSDAKKHRKPVMIGESTPRYEGTVAGERAWSKWFLPYFRLIEKHPHIKAFCYINASWIDFPDRTFNYDCRIQKSGYVMEHFRKELEGVQYIHQK
jgi:hypothetical protein